MVNHLKFFFFFYPKKGIRLGDPLSPYLVILCSESLSSLISVKNHNRNLLGCKIARNNMRIFFFFLVDGSLLSLTACNHVTDILHIYERASGQSVNFSKFALLSRTCANTWVFLLIYQEIKMGP